MTFGYVPKKKICISMNSDTAHMLGGISSFATEGRASYCHRIPNDCGMFCLLSKVESRIGMFNS